MVPRPVRTVASTHAPGSEPRSCTLPGYTVTPDPVGTSGWPSCVSTYGQSAVYQCCSTAQPPAQPWERIFDFGNGPSQDIIYLAFDGNPFWDPNLSCCFPMRYAAWSGTTYGGAVNIPVNSMSFAHDAWVHVAVVHEASGTATEHGAALCELACVFPS